MTLGEDKSKYLYITFISIFYDTLIVYLLQSKFIKITPNKAKIIKFCYYSKVIIIFQTSISSNYN